MGGAAGDRGRAGGGVPGVAWRPGPPTGRRLFEQVWPGHADGIGRYFAQPPDPHDIGELAGIPGSLIKANENHGQHRLHQRDASFAGGGGGGSVA